MKAWIKIEGWLEVEVKGRENAAAYLDRVIVDEYMDPALVKRIEVRDVVQMFSAHHVACLNCGKWHLSPAPNQEAALIGCWCQPCREEHYQQETRRSLGAYR